MASLSELFGFSKAKTPDYSGLQRPKKTITESVMYQPTVEGIGGIKEALARRGTGYAPEVMDANRSAWANLAKQQFRDFSAQTGATTSAAGLGRSTLRSAQETQGAGDLSNQLAARAAELQRQSQEAEIQQQAQARGLGAGLIGTDISASQYASDFDKDLALKQYSIERANEDRQLSGIGKTVSALAPIAGSMVSLAAPLLGSIPGIGSLLSGGANMLGTALTGLPQSSGIVSQNGMDNDDVARIKKALGIA